MTLILNFSFNFIILYLNVLELLLFTMTSFCVTRTYQKSGLFLVVNFFYFIVPTSYYPFGDCDSNGAKNFFYKFSKPTRCETVQMQTSLLVQERGVRKEECSQGRCLAIPVECGEECVRAKAIGASTRWPACCSTTCRAREMLIVCQVYAVSFAQSSFHLWKCC